MRGALLRLAGLVVIAVLQFAVYPGHGFTSGDGEIFVPQMERLESPGMLTRDLVATHPNLTFTIFDEATLFIHRRAHVDLRRSIETQQFLARLAGLAGIALLCVTAGLTEWWPLAIAAFVGFVGKIPGCELAPLSTEATPTAIALGLIWLAAGLFTSRKPLLAGFCGGLALIYDPRITAPFWCVLLLAFLFDGSLRTLIRPMFTIFTVFALLLANFAQWQPATAETRGMFERIPPVIEAVQRFRTPDLWITQWPGRTLLLQAALILLGGWAVLALRSGWHRTLLWLFWGLPLAGLAALCLSLLSLEAWHLRTGPLLQPGRTVLFSAVCSVLACAIAAVRCQTRERWLFLTGPLLLGIAAWTPLHGAREQPSVREAAAWAFENTWGGSMFLFPDAGQGKAPGQFRAEAERAVWVDWETGKLCDSSDLFADEWQRRWRDTMSAGYSVEKIRRLLALPVDYVVLQNGHSVPGAAKVFSNAAWSIYDARELRMLLLGVS